MDHLCFDRWWLNLLLRMHEHVFLIFPIFFWHHPAPWHSQLSRTNQSSRFSCSDTPSGKPLSPHSEMHLFSSHVLWQTLLQSLLVALITYTEHILHVHLFQGCWFLKHRDHRRPYTASWTLVSDFLGSNASSATYYLCSVSKLFTFINFHFPTCRMEIDVIPTS